MKQKMFFGSLALFLMALAWMPAVHAAEGEFEEAFTQDDTGASDPSEFEGDSENMPGERAPENLPVEDVPVDAGIGVEI